MIAPPALPLVDLAALHEDIGEEIEEALLRVCRSYRYAGGPEVDAFECAFGKYVQARHVIGVANGTDALELSLRALGIGAGDEVLVPANTFVATAEAVCAVGARPRFVDVEADSGLLDLHSCEERLSERAKAIIPVHLYGRMVNMGPVENFASRHGIFIVEDAAQAHGAVRDGRCAGTVGDAGCFSFYPGKNLGALGDAGAVVTGDEGVADRVRLLRDHGRSGQDDHTVVGRNSRLDPLQAAVLVAKLPHLDRWTEARRRCAAGYRADLEPALLDWSAPLPASEVHHLFPICLQDRDRVAGELREAGVGTGVHYRRALPTLAAFEWSTDRCPVAEQRAAQQLSLPMHPYLKESGRKRVVEAVGRIVTEGQKRASCDRLVG